MAIRNKGKKEQIQSLTLFRNPILVPYYFSLSLLDALSNAVLYLSTHLTPLVLFAISFAISISYLRSAGYYEASVDILKHYCYWVALGIASSVGLGTGLHTFVLFLGPHIAQVTLTSYTCSNTNFSTRGPSAFDCVSPSASPSPSLSLLIFYKVFYESFFWGLGTAIGELPPYFVARAAAAAGQDDDDFASIEQIIAKPRADRTWSEATQVYMYKLMHSWGFWGILVCASIPNPLFDLAGIICGHFSIPFYTFFGATLLGKAIFKSSIQTAFIITIFSKETLGILLGWMQRHVPYVHAIVKKSLDEQVRKFTNGTGDSHSKGGSVLGMVWNGILALMIFYFLSSIVTSLANTRMKLNSDTSSKATENNKPPDNVSVKQKKKSN